MKDLFWPFLGRYAIVSLRDSVFFKKTAQYDQHDAVGAMRVAETIQCHVGYAVLLLPAVAPPEPFPLLV